MEEITIEYRQDEFFYVDVPAIVEYCLPALVKEFLRLAISQFIANLVYRLIITGNL